MLPREERAINKPDQYLKGTEIALSFLKTILRVFDMNWDFYKFELVTAN